MVRRTLPLAAVHNVASTSGHRRATAFFDDVWRSLCTRFDVKENSSGNLARFLLSETAHLRGAVADAAGQLAQNILGIGIALALAFMNGWKLALVVLATMPLMMVVIAVQTSMMTSLSSKVLFAGLLLLSLTYHRVSTNPILKPYPKTQCTAAFRLDLKSTCSLL